MLRKTLATLRAATGHGAPHAPAGSPSPNHGGRESGGKRMG